MASSKSSLSSVVSKLTRASMGTVAQDVKDEDLDRYVADLILKEAKQAEEKYKGKEGIRAYLPLTGLPENSLPKTNKRFLHSIIRNVDDHNSALLQAQAKSAESIRAEREEAERAERSARAVEASQERLRRLMGGSVIRRRSRERREASSSRPSSSSSYRNREGDSSKDWRTAPPDDDYPDSPRPLKRRRKDGRSRYEDGGDADLSRYSRRTPHSASPPSRSRSHKENRVSPEEASTSSPSHPTAERDGRRHSVRDRQWSPDDDTGEDGLEAGSPQPDGSLKWGGTRSRWRDHAHSSSRPRSRSRSKTPEHSSKGKERVSSHDVKDLPSRSRHSSRRHHDDESSSSSKHKKHSKRSRHRDDAEEPSRSSKSSYKRSPTDDDGGHEGNLDGEDIGPHLSLHSSKMDKYFDPNYDPALDYTPSLDLNSLVADGNFDGWNTMLHVVRMRREDKEEKKRREKVGLPPSTSEREKEPGLMDIKYKKHGATREWDLGKD